MFKPVPNAVGCLTQSCSSVDNILFISTALFNYLQSNVAFGAGETTYLSIGEVPYKEYVRVTAINPSNPVSIIVDRGLNGTQARLFNLGDMLRYEITAEAIHDIAVEAGSSVSIKADYPLSVSQNEDTGVWSISIEELQLNGSTSIEITGEWPEFGFAVIPNSQGCCGNGG